MLLFQLDGLDDPQDDDCVDIAVVRGTGQPTIGGDGYILPDQTFDVDAAAPRADVACARLSGGMLLASPISLRIPLVVFDEFIDLTVTGGVLRLDRTETGWAGTLGGAVSVNEILTNVASLDGIGDQIPAMIEGALTARADLGLDPFGTCLEVSITMSMEAVPAYLYPSE
jgi:hypothetical protein